MATIELAPTRPRVWVLAELALGLSVLFGCHGSPTTESNAALAAGFECGELIFEQEDRISVTPNAPSSEDWLEDMAHGIGELGVIIGANVVYSNDRLLVVDQIHNPFAPPLAESLTPAPTRVILQGSDRRDSFVIRTKSLFQNMSIDR